ncbi:MAG: hypothetical protein ACK5LY_07925 [Lachnospirales bacterium]
MSSFTKKDLIIIEDLIYNQTVLSKKYKDYSESSLDIEVKNMFAIASTSTLKNIKDLKSLL